MLDIVIWNQCPSVGKDWDNMATKEWVGGNEWGKGGGLLSPHQTRGQLVAKESETQKRQDHIGTLLFPTPEAKGESWASNHRAQSEAIHTP